MTVSSLVGESDASRLTLGSQISDDSHIVDGMDATDVAEKSGQLSPGILNYFKWIKLILS